MSENFGVISDRMAKYEQYDKKYSPIVKYINENTNEDDYVCFLGERATFNSITGRKYPTRFTDFFVKYKEEFMDDLRTNKPVLIVFNKKPNLGGGTWGEFPIESMDILKPYLDINYLKVDPPGLNDFAIYRFKSKKSNQ